MLRTDGPTGNRTVTIANSGDFYDESSLDLSALLDSRKSDKQIKPTYGEREASPDMVLSSVLSSERAIINFEQRKEPIAYNLENANKCLNLIMPGLFIIAGVTESGKTMLCKLLLYYNHDKYDKVLVVCPTKDLQDSYDFIDHDNIKVTADEDYVIELLDSQEDRINQKNPQRLCLILDDFIGSEEIKLRSKLFNRIAGTSRHYQISIFLITQHLNILPPIIRDNARSCFITKLKASNLKVAHELQSEVASSTQFISIMNDIARHKYRFVRIDKDSSIHIFDSLLPPKFKIQDWSSVKERYYALKKFIELQRERTRK